MRFPDPPKKAEDAERYQRGVDAVTRRRKELSRAGRDCGPIPEPENGARRQAACDSFRTFCETYFPERFYLAWSPDHLRILGKMEALVNRDGHLALAMPRGSGKTTLCNAACVWALLTGRRRYVVLISSTATEAEDQLASLKSMLEAPLLAEDFPEACVPIRALEGDARKARGQLIDGERSRIEWSANRIVFARVPDAACSESVVEVRGLTGHLRGMHQPTSGGEELRPDLVILDDPQTRESAYSPSQSATREGIIRGDVLGLAGPDTTISAIMPCTVIAEGDLSDRMLDREANPDWRGERTQLVYRWPDDEALWDEYLQIRADELRNDGDGSRATEFYEQHREAMDAGAKVAWPERHPDGAISAIQHAFHLRAELADQFEAEYQNQPAGAAQDPDLPTIDANSLQYDDRKPGIIAHGTQQITVGIDVQGAAIYWLAAGWDENFGGSIIDWGVWPEQKQRIFHLDGIKRTLRRKYQGVGHEAAVQRGLVDLQQELLVRSWTTENTGAAMGPERLLVDSGYLTGTVAEAVRIVGDGRVQLCKGLGIKAGNKPFSEYRRNKGDRMGVHWRIPGHHRPRQVHVDVNWWKTFLARRLTTAKGDPGCLQVAGTARSAENMVTHLQAEYATRTEGHGRIVYEWSLRPGRPDNHWWDCLVYAATAAAINGLAVPGVSATTPKKQKRRRSKKRAWKIEA